MVLDLKIKNMSIEFITDKDGFFLFNLKDNGESNSGQIYTYISDTSNIDLNVLSTTDASLSFRFGNSSSGSKGWENILIPYINGKYYKFELYETENVSVYFLDIISDSSSNSGSNSTMDSTTVANWGFSTDTDTQIDSTGIASLGYVAGPHTIDTDTQLDSAGIAALGYVAGSTVDTQIDSTGIANLGYVAGPKTIDTDTDTQLDSAGVAALGFVAGSTLDTQIDSAGIAALGFIDSVTVMNMINNSSGGSGNSFAFPEGYNGTPITHFFGGGSYTVPAGKSLYITTRYSSNSNLKINK